MLTESQFQQILTGYYPDDVARSLSLNARCYTEPQFLDIERNAIFYRSWQWVCHLEKVREPGAYYVADVLGRSIAIVRGDDGELRAFY
ncbi:MAG: Rieske 2Fe-2S domain-containing protein, partial [Gammaproteobacteria bacterium]